MLGSTVHWRGGAVAAVALAAVVLSGCAAGSAAPTAAPDAAATPIPEQSPGGTPTEPDAGVTAIVVRFDGFELRGASDEIVRLVSFEDDAEEVVDTLSAVFGAEPAFTDNPGYNDAGPAHEYDWSGFRLIDGQGDEGGAITQPNLRAFAEASAVGSVSISTMQGIRVGDNGAAATALLGAASAGMSCWGPAAEYGPMLGDSVLEGEPLAYGVEVGISPETGLVHRLVATQLYGAGCA